VLLRPPCWSDSGGVYRGLERSPGGNKMRMLENGSRRLAQSTQNGVKGRVMASTREQEIYEGGSGTSGDYTAVNLGSVAFREKLLTSRQLLSHSPCRAAFRLQCLGAPDYPHAAFRRLLIDASYSPLQMRDAVHKLSISMRPKLRKSN
jgi:hypothetical protein